jgi:4-hydroxy-tetrahydrodipicolinate reductase
VPGVAIFGISGRMGQSLLRALREPVQAAAGKGVLHLSGAVASPGSAALGRDAAAEGAPCGLVVTDDAALALTHAQVALDFSQATAVAANARACASAGVALLVGTTGLDAAAHEALKAAALQVPVLIAPNTSLGVSLLLELVATAARALDLDYDVEISEAHHRAKRDAPSGTALALGAAVAEARGGDLSQLAVFERRGSQAPRVAGTIGFSSLRAGDIVGDHTVTFASAGERLELTHRATDRMTFARGALRAAVWLSGRPPGLYRMADVFGGEEA